MEDQETDSPATPPEHPGGAKSKPKETRLKNWHVFIACLLVTSIAILAVAYPDAFKSKFESTKALFKTRSSHLEDARQLALEEQRGWVRNGARVAVILSGYEDSKEFARQVRDRGIEWVADHERDPSDADAQQWVLDVANEHGLRPSPYSNGRSDTSMLIEQLNVWRHFQQKEWFEDKFSPHLDGYIALEERLDREELPDDRDILLTNYIYERLKLMK